MVDCIVAVGSSHRSTPTEAKLGATGIQVFAAVLVPAVEVVVLLLVLPPLVAVPTDVMVLIVEMEVGADVVFERLEGGGMGGAVDSTVLLTAHLFVSWFLVVVFIMIEDSRWS